MRASPRSIPSARVAPATPNPLTTLQFFDELGAAWSALLQHKLSRTKYERNRADLRERAGLNQRAERNLPRAGKPKPTARAKALEFLKWRNKRRTK